MSEFKEYLTYDGLGLAELIQKKEISASELCEAAILRIEKLNPEINAVVTPMFDLARKSVNSTLPENSFSGVPFLLKDLLAAYAGVPLTNGSKAYKNYIPEQDSELVKRFKSAGLVTLGKTNCPEFGLLGYTEPELHGATRNPWNTDHTPGGSSGGSAAAVSSGMVPMASAGDGGGSIRIPASCCGLFGIKPSRGRNPTGPDYGQIWQGAVAEHIVSRSVRDSAAMLDITQGTDVGAPYIIPPPEKTYLEMLEMTPAPLRIAFSTKSPVEMEVDGECIEAVAKTAKMLEQLGHHVEEATPEIDGISLAKSYMTLYFGEIAADIEQMKTVLGRKTKRTDVESLTWMLGLMGRTYSAGHFVSAMREWDKAARIMGQFHQNYDLYLTPTMAAPPVKIGELKPKPAEQALLGFVNRFGLGRLMKASGIIDQLSIESLSKTPFTQLANFTGQPAMSLPLHVTRSGLPCGVQFIGRFGEEDTLFQLASQLEKEMPWQDRLIKKMETL